MGDMILMQRIEHKFFHPNYEDDINFNVPVLDYIINRLLIFLDNEDK